ncbi:sugar ABC transporter substrate-binding protein [Pseudolysinimonas kribbensis]
MRIQKPSRRSVRLLSAAAAAVAAGLVLAGCSGGGSGSGPVTISYAVWDDTQAKVMRTLADEFHQQNPDITVKVQLTPWEQYWTKLKTAATGGAAPDVFWMNESNFATYANGGVIADLSDKLKGSSLTMSDYIDIQTKAYTWKGDVYGIPKDIDAIGLWYNKTLFQQAGVAAPTADWTWDDMVAAAQKLTDPAKGVYGIAAQPAAQQSYYSTIPQTGGTVISADKKKSGYDTPEAIKGVQVWVDLINKYHVSPTLQQMTDTDPDSMFTSGKVAMIYEGSWAAAEFADVPYAKANADVAPMPKLDKPGGVSNGLANVMAAKTAHPDQAFKFLEFLGSKKAETAQAAAGIVIPAYKGAAGGWVDSFPNYHLQVFVDALKNSSQYPSSLNSAIWQDAATAEFNKAWTGDETVAAAAKKVAAQMDKALAAEK